MIIYIDKTIGERCKRAALTQEEELFFCQLAIAHRRGDCLLCGELTTLEHLCQHISRPYANLYKSVCGRYSEIKSIIDFVELVLVITTEQKPVIPEFIFGKQRVLLLDEALKTNIFDKCYLVGENLNDCAFYTVMADRFRHKLPIRDIQINFCNENGGGDTTNLVFKKCVIEDKRLTLCLADSDKKHGKTKEYPNDPARGETIKKIERVYDELKIQNLSSICEIYSLSVHEVENLIPLLVLEKICDSGVFEMTDGIVFLRLLVSSNLGDAILCYDFKEGDKKINDLPGLTYWLEVLNQVGRSTMPGLHCSKLLERALKILRDEDENISNIAIHMTLESYLVPYWESIGKKVFSWGCCNLPSSA